MCPERHPLQHKWTSHAPPAVPREVRLNRPWLMSEQAVRTAGGTPVERRLLHLSVLHVQ